MSHEELPSHTAGELIALYRARKVSPVEATRSCLSRIDLHNSEVRAYITVFADQALIEARQAEKAYLQGRAEGLLCGVPMSVKDVFWTRDVPTTWGARALAGYRPRDDSTVVTRLREAGAIILGKTNVDTSLSWNDENYPHLIGSSRNPWDLDRTAGWSSGGSGASVAALFDYASVGTDTAGSIRIPAAFCGVVGLRRRLDV